VHYGAILITVKYIQGIGFGIDLVSCANCMDGGVLVLNNKKFEEEKKNWKREMFARRIWVD
jgi:hypothetical protein